MSRNARALLARLERRAHPEPEASIVLDLVPVAYDADGRPLDAYALIREDDPPQPPAPIVPKPDPRPW